MPQAARSRSRALLVFLLLTLLAFPVFAGKQRAHAFRGRGALISLWQALMGFVPVIVPVVPVSDPPDEDDQETNGSEGDLGPSLDPLG